MLVSVINWSAVPQGTSQEKKGVYFKQGSKLALKKNVQTKEFQAKKWAHTIVSMFYQTNWLH